MNLRSIALALVVTSPSLLACADNIRKARELRPSRGAPGPQEEESPPETTTTETPPTTESPESEEEELQDEETQDVVPRTSNSNARHPVTASATPEISSTPPNDTRTPNTPKPASRPGISSVETSSHKFPPSPTNDCITFPITDPWEFIYQGYPQSCQTYDPKYQPWNNYDYCNEDVGTDGILAKDACPQCGQCLGPENTCVAFGKKDPFNAGYGECHSYKKGLENHDYCYSDEDNGIKAFQACQECGKCVESSPRTVKISVEWLRPTSKGDDPNNNVELIGNLGSQLEGMSRLFWKSNPNFTKIQVGKTYLLGKTHYYYDVGDWEYISAKGTLREYDYGNGDDFLGTQKMSFEVGELYHKGTTQMVFLNWYDRTQGNRIQALFKINVY